MASIRRETVIEASPERVWAALRDIGALHTRLAPGFVTNVILEPGARMVTFANGMVVRERIISVDDGSKRVVWSAASEQLSHHNGAAQVLDEGKTRCRFVWIADLLPDEMAPTVTELMEQGLKAIKQHLEKEASRGSASTH